jgi:hypothetical protein
MQLSFHGADQDVTGSCHLLECAGKRLLIDCGMFQGGRELEEENAAPFGFEAADLDFVLLTHAHLDHCGRLPLLVKRGFRGEIISTAATAELAQIVMQDAAHMARATIRGAARASSRSIPKPMLLRQRRVSGDAAAMASACSWRRIWRSNFTMPATSWVLRACWSRSWNRVGAAACSSRAISAAVGGR